MDSGRDSCPRASRVEAVIEWGAWIALKTWYVPNADVILTA